MRHSTPNKAVSICKVSIHAPTQGATGVEIGYFPEIVFQSTHPRRVRLQAGLLKERVIFVSIHAPTQGATYDWESRYPKFYVSIHAPTQGATGGTINIIAHKGVSIHAPTQGATSRSTMIQSTGKFQSTHPRRVRHIESFFTKDEDCFNPRTHAGCDYQKPEGYASPCCFNPRTHAGCDPVQ